MAAGREPLVSVMMNALNGAQYLREAIESIYAQSYQNWEIVFWDNASTDETPQIAKSFDRRMRYFRSDRTLPLYAARKLSMEQCRGDIIGFLDVDDLWHPEKLRRQVACFDGDDQVGLVYSNAEILNADGSRRPKFSSHQPEGDIFRQLVAKYHLCLPTVLISRRVCDKHNLAFDDSFCVSGDADLFMRIAQVSQAKYLHEITATYRQHPASGTLRHLHVIPYEVERILQKLGTSDHEFFDKYHAEIIRFRLQGQMSVLVALWRMGRTRELRSIIRTHWQVSSTWGLLFIASFMPEQRVSWLRSMLK